MNTGTEKTGSLVPGHIALLTICQTIIVNGARAEDVKVFGAHLVARKHDIIPEDDKSKVMQMVLLTGCNACRNTLVLGDMVQDFLEAQIGREGVNDLVATTAPGWEVIETSCRHGYHIVRRPGEEELPLIAKMIVGEISDHLRGVRPSGGFPDFGAMMPPFPFFGLFEDEENEGVDIEFRFPHEGEQPSGGTTIGERLGKLRETLENHGIGVRFRPRR